MTRRRFSATSLVLEWCRYFVERLVLIPAADLVPKRWVLLLADASGFCEAMLPCTATNTARREIMASMGLGGVRAYVATARRLAAPRRDLVTLRRLRRGREHPRDWKLCQVNAERVQAMLAENRPFVVCNGHFPHGADLVLPDVLIPQLPGNSLHAPVPAWKPSPSVLRIRLQNSLLYGLSRKLAGFPPEVLLPFAGAKDAVSTMVEQLREPGGVVRIFIDAVWEKPNAYRRPFAGLRERGFALGTARVARLAQCPIVFSVAVFDPDGAARIEWGPWIEPPPVADAASDVRTMDQLIDALERAVGRYPLQYLHSMGYERTWDAASERWLPPAVNGSGSTSAGN